MDALSSASDAVSDMDLAGASLRVRICTHAHCTRMIAVNHHLTSLLPSPFLASFFLLDLFHLPPSPFPSIIFSFISFTSLIPIGCGPALGTAAHPSCFLSASGLHHIRFPSIPCLPTGQLTHHHILSSYDHVIISSAFSYSPLSSLFSHYPLFSHTTLLSLAQWLGKNSTTGKFKRLTQELVLHSSLALGQVTAIPIKLIRSAKVTSSTH